MKEFKSQSTFSFEKNLGSGGLGQTDLYIKKTRGAPDSKVVVKTLRCESQKSFEELLNEGEILSSVSHSNIVKNLGYEITNEGKIGLLLEYVEGKNLFEILPTLNMNSRTLLAPYVVEVVLKTISDLHGDGLIHGDISSNNILISRDGRIKISDFGLSSRENVALTGPIRGKKYYLSQDRLENLGPATKACDIYAIGVLAFEILTGYYCDSGSEISDPLLWQELEGWGQFFEAALNSNSKNRVSAKELLKMVPVSALSQSDSKNLLSNIIGTFLGKPTSVRSKFPPTQIIYAVAKRTIWNSVVAMVSILSLVSTPTSVQQNRKSLAPRKLTEIVITSEGVGKVKVDGRWAGYTPYTRIQVTVGQHQFLWKPIKGKAIQKRLMVIDSRPKIVIFKNTNKPEAVLAELNPVR